MNRDSLSTLHRKGAGGSFKYFNRDISWLSFNYRLLEEAADMSLPLYERLKFLAIYASNLDEFYKVRVAEYKYNVDKEELDSFSEKNPGKIVHYINSAVNKQLHEFERIYKNEILNGLKKEGIILFQEKMPEHRSHLDFINDYFFGKALPHLQPVFLKSGSPSYMFDNAIYLAIRLQRSKKKADKKKKG